MFLAHPAYAYHIGDVEVGVDTGISESYDDNISSAKENKKADAITNLSLGLKAAYEGKNASCGLKGSFIQHLYAKNHAFDNIAEILNGTGTAELSKYDRISAGDDFTHAEEPTSFEDEFGRTSGKYSYLLNRFKMNYIHDVSKQLSVNAGYSNEAYAPSRQDLSDSYEHTLNAGADYAVDSATILLLAYQFSHRSFNPGPTAYINTLSAGARRYLTSQFSVEATIGGNFIHSFTGQDLIRPLYTVTAVDEVDKNTKATLSFVKEYQTNSYTSDIFDSWRVSAGLSHQLLERLSGAMDLFYGEGTYKSQNITDKNTGAGVAFRYDLRENAALTAGYRLSNVLSSDPGRGYVKNQFTLGATITF